MKKITFLFALILFTSISFSQKKEKIKGSKKVTLETKVVGDFDVLEVSDDLEITIVKGDKCSIEIEADDNIHEALGITLNGTNLSLNMAKNIGSYKKFQVRVNYTTALRTVISRLESSITALATIELDDITFKAFDYSKLILNAKTKNFSLIANDKTRTELSIKSENSILELSKGSSAKLLLSTGTLKLDLYQNSIAEIEGDAADMKLRMSNDSDFKGKKLAIKRLELITEDNSNAIINVNETVSIEAIGSSDIELYGTQKIDMKKFDGESKLIKKMTR
jgi:Putative auto-transporter adhesin, head GIN domain